MNKLVIDGSSKAFYETDNPDIFRMEFKDAIHGRGKHSVIPGTGRLREEFCYYFYRFLEKQGIATHLVPGESLLSKGILVKKAEMIPLELIMRFVTRGHWVDRHKFPLLPQGVELDPPVIELCVKWKQNVQYLPYLQLTKAEKLLHKLLSPVMKKILLPAFEVKDDPRVNKDMIFALHKYAIDEHLRGHLISTEKQYEELIDITKKVNHHLQKFLATENWILEDGKFETGILDGKLVVADEYTQDSVRIKDAKGNSLTKDLFRENRPIDEIINNYSKLTEKMKEYAS